ncbi:MAG: carbon monoxide dehydrogenase [Candidatus Hecatellales archaeon]|nr:MAG: carbon monoxide dehydrogenase [Candidatus Hecatellales archaeon]
MSEFSWVGKPHPPLKMEGVPKVTGEAIYTVDVKLPGMLVGKILRSPHPHAKILRIDKSKAERLPGVKAVLTFEDIPKVKYASSFRDMPMATSGTLQPPDQYVLTDKARYVGDPVAAVAAVDEYVAEEALKLIEVEYEPLPAVFTIDDALKPDAPQIHDHAKGNIAAHVKYPFAQGDVEKGFAEADCVVEGTFFVPRQVGAHLEPQACTAYVDPTGKVTVWSPCQLTFPLRRELAKIFSLPEGMINVVTPFVGGSFGTRLSLYCEPIAIALAMKTGKPVKIVHSKEEDFSTLETRTADRVTVKAGFKKDGTLIAMQMKVYTWAGAYAARAYLAGPILLMWGLGHYRCPNTDGECFVVYTNTTPAGAMRGYGNPEASTVVEQIMDMAAEKLGIDPVELRLKNVKKAGEPSNLGPCPIESTYEDECIRIGAERIGWWEKRKLKKQEGVKRRGLGMAAMMHCSGAWPLLIEHSSAMIKFNEDGSVNMIINPAFPGTHCWTTLAQIAAEELGISPEDVHVVTGSTDTAMFDLGSHASRTTYVTGNAVLEAAREAKRQLLERASKMLGVSPEELTVKDGRVFVKADPSKGLTIGEIARSTIWDLKGESFNISGKASWSSRYSSPPTGAYFTEVEVDTETGEVKVLKFVVVIDCGRVINPMTVEGQIQGGISQGIGYALYEDYVINKKTGVVESDNFNTYRIATNYEMPEEIEIIFINKPDPKGPFGAKGVGEPAMVGVAAAIANAVYDAIGVRLRELPITPEKILKALKEKEKG